MVRLLTLTGLRRDEVADACWAELGEQVWTIPKERMKSDAAFVVPLTKQMLAIIQALPRFKPGLHQVYDLEAYLEERRRGGELWAERLMAIVVEPPPER